MDMSNFRVPYTKILRIEPHTNSHSLELAYCFGFQLIVQKGKFQPGSKVVFVPIDSILPANIEEIVFGKDAKVKLHNSRVRQIKLRGQVAQGLVIDPELLSGLVNFKYIKDEQDLSAVLGITKYEPPAPRQQNVASGIKLGRKKLAHPSFHEYNGLTNLKWAENFFEGEEVVIQCKLHGTNSRAALLPFRANTIFKKLQKFFGYAPPFERLYGSNRVDISNASNYKGYYSDDVYGKVFKKIDVFSKLKLGETVFGEIIGPGIQKGYEYGLKEHAFVLFDVKVLKADGTQEWMKPEDVEAYAKDRGFEFVPVLYMGIYNKELAKQLSMGPSVYYPGEPVREGIAIKSRYNYSGADGSKRGLKLISEEYLSNKDNTDEH
jgi:RNA ligase (TIGR02306 family)